MPVVFGYGSLINHSSAEKTLGRSLCRNELCCATISDYVRSWTARDCVRLMTKEQRVIPCDALFLDLTRHAGRQCNGVLFNVDNRELRQLDIREKGYERCEVELETVDGERVKGFTYVIPDEDKQHHGIILARYKDIVDDALQDFPPHFVEQFWDTTLNHDVMVVDGEYVFENCAQNAAAGRTLTGD